MLTSKSRSRPMRRVCSWTRSRRRPTKRRMSRSSSLSASMTRRSRRIPDLIGDDAGVAGVGLVLPAPGALPGAVDGQSRRVDQAQTSRRQHRFGQAGDTADHIEADRDLALQGLQFGNQSRDGRGRIVELAVNPDLTWSSTALSRCTSLATYDPDGDAHRLSPLPYFLRHSFVAGVALHSDRSQSPIRGQQRENEAGGSASGAIDGSQHENHPT